MWSVEKGKKLRWIARRCCAVVRSSCDCACSIVVADIAVRRPGDLHAHDGGAQPCSGVRDGVNQTDRLQGVDTCLMPVSQSRGSE
jgi:hypothetical protein